MKKLTLFLAFILVSFGAMAGDLLHTCYKKLVQKLNETTGEMETYPTKQLDGNFLVVVTDSEIQIFEGTRTTKYTNLVHIEDTKDGPFVFSKYKARENGGRIATVMISINTENKFRLFTIMYSHWWYSYYTERAY